MSDKVDNSALHWISSHWITILVVIIVFIIITGIIKLFTGSGSPLLDGIDKALGAGSNFVNGLVNGCTPQTDCTPITDATACTTGTNGCAWNPPIETGKTGNCVNTTGKDTGSGSFVSSTCLVGIGAILWLTGTIVVTIFGPLIVSLNNNKNLETNARISNKSKTDVLADVKKDAVQIGEEAKTSLGEITDERLNDIGSKAASVSSRNKAQVAIDAVTELTPEQYASETQEVLNNYLAEIKDQEQNNSSVSPAEKTEDTDACEKAGGEVLSQIINNYVSIYRLNKSILPENVFYYFDRQIIILNIKLHPLNQNYMSYHKTSFIYV